MTTDRYVALVRQAIFHVLDNKPGGWRFDDLNDDIANAERVDFADEVVTWLSSAIRSKSTEAPKSDPIADLCEKIKQDIRYCDHGYIYITCGQCVATWLRG